MKIVGSRLRVAISRAGYRSINEFANKCEFSRPIISNLCNDKYPYEVTDFNMRRLCIALHVTPEYLTGIEGFDDIEDLTKEEKAQRLLFDLFVTLGRIEPLADGSGRFRFHGYSGYTNLKSIEMSEHELHSILGFMQRRIDKMCDEYIELCGIHSSEALVKQRWSKEHQELLKELFEAKDKLREYEKT